MKEVINKVAKSTTFEYAKNLMDCYFEQSKDSHIFLLLLKNKLIERIRLNKDNSNFEVLEYVEIKLNSINKLQLNDNESLRIAISWSELNENAKNLCITLLFMGCRFGKLTRQNQFFKISHNILSSNWYFEGAAIDLRRDIMSALCNKIPDKHKFLDKDSKLIQSLDWHIKTAQHISSDHIHLLQDILFHKAKNYDSCDLTFMLCMKRYKIQNIVNVPKVLCKLICDIAVQNSFMSSINKEIYLLTQTFNNNKVL